MPPLSLRALNILEDPPRWQKGNYLVSQEDTGIGVISMKEQHFHSWCCLTLFLVVLICSLSYL